MSENTELEIIYELRWKNHIRNHGSDVDKANNIMGILDTPDTCADWITFKSYLMQNSGVSEDMSIAYINNDGEEITLTNDVYKTALEYAREKARKGERVILTIKKPNIKSHHYSNVKANGGGKHKNKYDKNKYHELCTKRHLPNPFYYIADATDSEDEDDQPPLWFLKYMKKFKQEIGDLIVESVYYMLQNDQNLSHHNFEIPIRCEESQQTSINLSGRCNGEKRKHKQKLVSEDSSDYLATHLGDRILRKVHKIQAREKKIERKYEAKIGKLENKMKRIIDKKVAVSKPEKHQYTISVNNGKNKRTTADSTEKTIVNEMKPEKYSKRVRENIQSCDKNVKLISFKSDKSTCCEPNEMVSMNAMPLNRQMITEFAGRGEVITKRWEVLNNGSTTWNDDTELRFTWGSSTLVPINKTVKVPHLKPGDVGTVEVKLQAPDAIGRFESYWYFYHMGTRFGHWLGCAYAIGLHKDDRCKQQSYYDKECHLHHDCFVIDLTKPKSYRVPHYESKTGPNAASTTDDMKMSKTNTDLNCQNPFIIDIEHGQCSTTKSQIINKPEKFEDKITATSDTLKLYPQLSQLCTDSLSKFSGHGSKPTSASNLNESLSLNLTEKPEKYENYSEQSAQTPTLLNRSVNGSVDNTIPLKPETYANVPILADENVIPTKLDRTASFSNKTPTDKLNIDEDEKINNKSSNESSIEEDDNFDDSKPEIIIDLDSDSDSDNISVISGTISVGSTDHCEEFEIISIPSEISKHMHHGESDLEKENKTTEDSQEENFQDLQTTASNTEPIIIIDKPCSHSINKSKIETSTADKKNEENNDETHVHSCMTCQMHPVLDQSNQNPPFLQSNFAHCTFGDPSCGNGPNGPRFPQSCFQHSSNNSHPTWRNGCSVFGNDFATYDQNKASTLPSTNETLVKDSSFQREAQYPAAYQNLTGFNCPQYSYRIPTVEKEVVGNSRRFVFSTNGLGFETYENENPVDDNEDFNERKPARYSYVYTNEKAVPTVSINKIREENQSQQQKEEQRQEIPDLARRLSNDLKNGVHILPETIVNGAIQVASNAYNTACNVYDMVIRAVEDDAIPTPPPPGSTKSYTGNSSGNLRQSSNIGSDINNYLPTSPTNQYSFDSGNNVRSLDNCLRILDEMGFYNRELNTKLLLKYDYDLTTVISKLV